MVCGEAYFPTVSSNLTILIKERHDCCSISNKKERETLSVSLSKGQKISLTKDTGIKKIAVALGWEVSSEPLDLDAVAFALSSRTGKPLCPKEEDFIFYGNKTAMNNSIIHTGDNRTGGDGDCEKILVDFEKIKSVDPSVDELAFYVTIFEAAKKNQTFGKLKNAYIKIYKEDNTVFADYDLDQAFPDARSVHIGSFTKDAAGDWHFTAIGNAVKEELSGVCAKYGIDAE